MGFTNADRQTGRAAMERTLTPLEKAGRRFAAGRPPAVAKNTPLAAVTLATEQRARLAGILAREPGLLDARVTSAVVVIRVTDGAGEHALGVDAVLVEEGKEGQAVATLEMYRQRAGLGFAIVGLIFAVLADGMKYPAAYLIERTPEGAAALQLSLHRQTSGVLKKQAD